MSDQFAAIFRRHPNDGWFRAGRYDVTTTDIVCILAVVTMFVYGAGVRYFSELVFFPPAVRNFEVWRLATWSVATEPAIWPLLGLIFFWLFGQHLEALFGRGRFLAWVLMMTFVPAVVLTVLGTLSPAIDNMAQFGLSNLFLGGIWVYAATYPGVKWFGVVPLWAVAVVFSLLNLLQFTGRGATGQTIFLLVSVATALFVGRSLGLATGWPIPHVPLDGAGRSSRPSRSKKPKQRKQGRGSPSSGQRVVEGPWRNAPPPTPPNSGPSVADQIELDSLLDKIGANGMDSLTTDEKKRLNDLSKRLRNR
jgi:hypothetical protein